MRLTTVIVWLMLALLPLRGWAHAAMGTAGWPGVATASVSMAHTGSAPCHEMGVGADNADLAAPSPADKPSGTSHCTWCDLCHAPMAGVRDMRLPAFALPATSPPDSGHTVIAVRAPERLERPPRTS